MYTDKEETNEIKEDRIEYFWKEGNQQFTKEGRNAEITVDLVLQARAKSSKNEVNGNEDAIVSEMIKKVAQGEDPHHSEVFSRTIYGQMESPSS